MKILDWVKQKVLQVPLFQAGSWNSFKSYFTGAKKAAEYYRGWVFTAVTAIAEEVSEIELHLSRTNSNGEKEIFDDHPAIKLLNTVNPFFTKKTLFERLQSNIELRGNEYWLIDRDSKKQPIGIYPLNPDCITPIVDPNEYVAGYEYDLGTKKYQIPKDEIVPFKTYNPKSDICGVSTLEAVRTTVETDEASKEYNKVFFENNAAPGVILSYPIRLTQEQIDKMKEQWDSEFKGFKKGYRTAVASGGLDIKTVDMTHSDMEFIESRKMNRDEILAIFRVPKTIAGVLEDVNFASAKAALYIFTRFNIKPKMTRIVDTLNEFYLGFFNDTEGMKFEYKSPVQEDTTEKIAYYESGLSFGYLTPNEVRRFENLVELEDGDSVYLPFNLTPYSKPKAKTVRERPGQKAIKTLASDIARLLTSPPSEELKKKVNLQIDVDMDRFGEGKIAAIKARTQGYEKLFTKTAMGLFDDQKKRAIASLNSGKSIKVKTTVLDEEYEIETTIDLFAPLFKDLTEKEGKEALRLIGLDPDDFSINTPSIQEFLKKNTKRFAHTITQKTSDDLRKLIAEGIDEGEAIVDLTKRIEDYSGFNIWRAEMIARSETIRAQGESERVAWEESKVVTSIIWYTALDERVDDDCSFLHGKEVGITESFLSEDDLTEMGLDVYDGAIDSPPLHPNCRCTLLPQVK